jgi:hypothetical protein
MIMNGGVPRDLSRLVVPLSGSVAATGDPFEPYRLAGIGEVAARAVRAFLGELAACGRADATLRSYGMDLLRWFRPINCTMSLISSQADRLVSQGAWCGRGRT